MVSERFSRNRREKSYSDRTHTQNNNNSNASKSKEEFDRTHTAFQEVFREEYSDFFRDHIATVTAYWRRKKRLYSLFVDSNWDLKAVVLIQVSYDRYKSFRATELSELRIQSFRATKLSELQIQSFRASNPGTKTHKTP